MDFSISHELANFVDYGNRLLRRLKAEGAQLSEMERRILLAHLRQLSMASEQLSDTRSRNGKDGKKEAA
jgi:hypothetical protein